MSAQPAEHPSVWDLALRRELTIDDLPEDEIGRTELIDGGVYVAPEPDFEHQEIATRILGLLLRVAPPHLTVVCPVNVILDERTLVIPDVVVADKKHLVRRGLGVEPAGVRLAVEITSPSTRLRDLTIKRELYRGWGVPLLIVDRSRTPYTWTSYGDLPEWAADLRG